MSNPLLLLPFMEEARSFDPRDYTAVNKMIQMGSTANTWRTMYESAGEGYFKQILMQTDTNELRGLKITIDGTIVYRSFGVTSGAIGVFDAESIIRRTDRFAAVNTGYVETLNGPLTAFPYVNGGDKVDNGGNWCCLPFPLSFKQSAKIEIMLTNGTRPGDAVSILGGVK